jgi:hypothetical protein
LGDTLDDELVCAGILLTSADPYVGGPPGCASGRTQNSQFGAARLGRLGERLADAEWRVFCGTLRMPVGSATGHRGYVLLALIFHRG